LWIAKTGCHAQNLRVIVRRNIFRILQQRMALLLFILLSLSASAAAQDYLREDLRIPKSDAGAQGLQALFIRPSAPGKYPLVIFSHGTPRDPVARRALSPYSYLPVAMQFARRGYAVAMVMRRSYGTSGGNYSDGVNCNGDANFTQTGLNAAEDIRTALDYFARRPDVDANTIIAVGESAGGLGSIALSSLRPRGLVAAISFAGGHGSTSSFQICQKYKLIDAFANYGKTSQIPTLWIYAENDTFFEPRVAQEFYNAFINAGGNAEFIAHPRDGEDGHNFIYRGVNLWPRYIDAFLEKNKLPRSRELLPVHVSVLPAPPRLDPRGLRSFQDFLNSGPNKAFAVSPEGAYGWRAGVNTREIAIEQALKTCAKHAPNCELYIVNEEVVKRLSPAAPGYER